MLQMRCYMIDQYCCWQAIGQKQRKTMTDAIITDRHDRPLHQMQLPSDPGGTTNCTSAVTLSWTLLSTVLSFAEMDVIPAGHDRCCGP